MIWRYYSPVIKWQLWAYPSMSVLIFLLCLIATPAKSLFAFGLLNTVLSLAMVLAPLAFGAMRGREVEAMLPAVGIERRIVVIGWCLIVVPLLIEVPFETLNYLVHGDNNLMYTLKSVPEAFGYIHGHVTMLLTLSGCMYVDMILSCVWGVFGAKQHRIQWGVLGVVFCYIGFAFFVMLVSAVAGFIEGYQAAMQGLPESSINMVAEHVAQQIMHLMSRMMIPVCIIYAIFALVKSCRAISRHQF